MDKKHNFADDSVISAVDNPKNIATYTYCGPESLGSVVNQNCAAVGLVRAVESDDFAIVGREVEGSFILQLFVKNQTDAMCTWQEEASSKGRSVIGRALLHALRDILQVPSSGWGDLVGVRPMKFYHKQWERLQDERAVHDFLSSERQVSDDKIALMSRIAQLQRPYLDAVKTNPKGVALYGGIPFCTTHCSYCSFPFGLIQEVPHNDRKKFAETFIQDCQHVQKVIETHGLLVDSAYMGGGTPTSLDEAEFAYLLKAFVALVPYGHECTIEAGRPDTVTAEKLQAMVRTEKVNRISINPQSMQDEILKSIGRYHKASDIDALYQRVRKSTKFSINMDFIAGLPRQTVTNMKANMDYVCQRLPENVTIHTLALKKGSPLYTSSQRMELPDAQTVTYMTEYCAQRLQAAGYEPYYLYRQQYMTGHLENIGYALPGTACAYNIQMMEERQPVIAIGPGTTSKWMKAPDFRQTKQYLPKDINTYIDTFDALAAKRTVRCEDFYGRE